MQSIDTLLGTAVAAGEVPAAVAVAVSRDGTVFEAAHGTRTPGGPPATPDTVMWIASLTKAVVSVAAMQLVEAGRLQLDAPLGALLPELAAPSVLEGFDAAGAPRLRPARSPVTLRHLLTHTAGFSYPMWNADIGRYMAVQGLPGTGSGRLESLRLPLVFDPGERWEYGISIDWVGLAIEAASGQGLDAFLTERVLGPLGMANTGFVPGAAQRERLAGMHRRGPDGALALIPFPPPAVRPEFVSGGGGLWSTGRDYGRFLRALLCGGSLDGARVLRTETVVEMGRNHIGALPVTGLRAAMPELSNDAEFFPGASKRWGLGFMLNDVAMSGGRAANSLAWAGLANCYYWIDPTHGVAGVLLCQVLPFADPTVLALFERFERAVYAGLGLGSPEQP